MTDGKEVDLAERYLRIGCAKAGECSLGESHFISETVHALNFHEISERSPYALGRSEAPVRASIKRNVCVYPIENECYRNPQQLRCSPRQP